MTDLLHCFKRQFDNTNTKTHLSESKRLSASAELYKLYDKADQKASNVMTDDYYHEQPLLPFDELGGGYSYEYRLCPKLSPTN